MIGIRRCKFRLVSLTLVDRIRNLTIAQVYGVPENQLNIK